MRNIYIASRFDRKTEMAERAVELRAAGWEIVSSWHDRDNDLPFNQLTDADRATVAEEDADDLGDAQVLLVFTSDPPGTGGHLVELGGVLLGNADKRVVVVGPRVNVFCYMAKVEWFPTWKEAKRAFGINES